MKLYFNDKEKLEIYNVLKSLLKNMGHLWTREEVQDIYNIINEGVSQGLCPRTEQGLNPILLRLNTALLITEQIAADRSMVMATLLQDFCKAGFISADDVEKQFGDDVANLVKGLVRVTELYGKQAAVKNENFPKLLLTFAQDIRVIIIMIVDRFGMMRVINHNPDEKFVKEIANEARFLYAPLAHRLGLYLIKSELEDISLKYLNRQLYTQIAHKLSETKRTRDQYVADFIAPLKKALEDAGLNFYIKGRTKSINSIWNKMQKQGVDLSGMYDLFAIRIIIDTPKELEKRDCWVAYSVVTDMYTANTSRLKDWITIPKSNGYESLHITVNGPLNHWVEVQIRTKRMDEVAERGLAAHWRYKGIKSEGGLDDWMNNVRDVLEAGSKDQMEMVSNMKMNVYEKEVFVFTPKGDLYKLPMGATLLDFAFHIHSKLGCSCIGGKVDGRNQKINYKLKSGDTIEILTSSTQTPKLAWLGFVVTSKARNKIKQSIHEIQSKDAEFAKELLARRFKNRKIEVDESTLMRLIKKLGFKTVTEFYLEIAAENIDVNNVLDGYLALEKKESAENTPQSAQNFVLNTQAAQDVDSKDVLVIGENIKGINYKLSKCCNPIYGDDIVGFIASDGAIKIHREDCPNARHLVERFPYRQIHTQWSGKIGAQFAVNLRVVGRDDIGIVTNISSVINKEKDTTLRSISIDSHDGVFQGYLVIGVSDIHRLDELVKKIKNLKGVSDVQRS